MKELEFATHSSNSVQLRMRNSGHCDRSASRAATSEIESNVLSLDGAHVDQLPENCPLNPLKGMYHYQESNQRPGRQKTVKCAFCGKSFKNQHYMDRHMDLKHEDKLLNNATVCLADYCDVLHCQSNAPVACREDDVKHSQLRCRALFDRCFPMEADKRLHDFYLHHYCDTLSCRGSGGERRSPFSQLHSSPGDASAPGGRVVLISILVVFLIVYYSAMLYLRRETATRRDLRPLRNNRQAGLWTSILKALSRGQGHRD